MVTRHPESTVTELGDEGSPDTAGPALAVGQTGPVYDMEGLHPGGLHLEGEESVQGQRVQEQRTLRPPLHHMLAANTVAAQLAGRKAALQGVSGFISLWTSPRSPPKAVVCALGPNALHSGRGGTAWGRRAVAAV